MTRGVRNLTLLGVSIIIFAIITTTISLTLYHNSGDIYLDRSRPGFLPDADEKTSGSATSAQTTYRLPETGEITPEILQDYLENYQKEIKKLPDNPFNPDKLSDAALGIPVEEFSEPSDYSD